MSLEGIQKDSIKNKSYDHLTDKTLGKILEEIGNDLYKVVSA